MKQKVNKEKYIKFSILYMFINLLIIGIIIFILNTYGFEYIVIIGIIAIYTLFMTILEDFYFSKYYLEYKDE